MEQCACVCEERGIEKEKMERDRERVERQREKGRKRVGVKYIRFYKLNVHFRSYASQEPLAHIFLLP